MRKWILAIVLAALPGFALASSEGAALDKANIDPTDKASLQRGAKLFVNYCMGCHSADYQRYNRLARDIGLSDEQVRDNLIFTGAKVGEGMRNAMPKKDAKKWFGAAPPDLTLIARARGVDYLYTYLRTFYIDEARPWGVNNAAFPLVGMPHVLSELQGWQKARMETHKDAHGNESTVITGYEIVKKGSMSPPEFDSAMRDLVNFLAYVAEPVKLYRQSLGVWVIAFLVLMTAVFYLLKKEYWKDIH
ncbi:cytochrome c1 [Plasticicumulans sp.]|uniref:cytochrome c1 n=1 Tax=Plasticicumulans sp. TaxID=2307179 RepID=UPI002BF39F0E|nr:cytochrome c1 [Plasticicumulans sp.]MBS0602929.1 cytochrome c1 [Pseudomonadota bacterium]HMV39060.1 cytochrome c1 [Plasticicumulans sp.]HMW28102.1 cytochrome c1 [Plasticicumulans sp.]HMW40845.1 cytochrome c1 [Plasticicumulans sp.]HMX53073.1 cytochrome c1 [Plasticicumulans sp.]